ncbi:MAG: methyltransferase domain-containing protein [Rhizobiaceae bacterium]|nr:MAG: methyltransferase domain-containing protein [Rhizobiaceae bacterium]CAG0983161.1 phosphatidylethanolamine/phosphatidyl-N-methylethanolamine N-methyltransferase [Rhizobiaceae bacterium]
MHQMPQRLTFLRQWLANPLMVGAVLPSGRFLARLMTQAIDQDTGSVLELGPGTGVFTEALLKRGLVPEQLTLVELDERFANFLSRRFPGARIVQGNAARLSAAGVGRDVTYSAVISGLPLLSMPTRTIFRIVEGVARRLGPSGNLYQFTYGARCPIAHAILERLGLEASLLGTVMWNLPPASVYRISRTRVDPKVTSASEPHVAADAHTALINKQNLTVMCWEGERVSRQ